MIATGAVLQSFDFNDVGIKFSAVVARRGTTHLQWNDVNSVHRLPTDQNETILTAADFGHWTVE
jgi:hypothetical protein